jgi:NAD(P)H dehydrogenase (quinone)
VLVVTGATGRLGRHVIDGLLAKLPAEQITVAVRNPDLAEAFAARGVEVRAADYNEPETLRAAFDGADRVLLISSHDHSRAAVQHAAAVDAAKQAGVQLLVYTSLTHADTTTLRAAVPHKATEPIIRESGIPFTILRNNLYSDIFAPFLAQALVSGTFIGSGGAGRVAGATRADYAAGAVAVLTGNGHENKVYELTAEASWNFAEMADELSKAAGKDITYQNISPEQHRDILAATGMPPQVVDVFVDTSRAIAAGELAETTEDLRTLLARPVPTLADLTRRIVTESAITVPADLTKGNAR